MNTTRPLPPSVFDSRAQDTYRERRIAELKALASKSRFGDVYQLVRADFVREVTEGSADCWVVVLLYSDSVMDSRRVEPIFSALARKHKATKFMRIEGRACIENYPDSNIPTILIYHKGEMQKRLITLGQMGGRDTNEEKLEWILFRAGAVESDLEGDPTLLAGREGPGIRASRMFLELERDGAAGTRGRGGRGRGEDEDEDEDDRDVKARSSLRTAALRGELGRGGGGGGGGRRGRDDEEEEG